MNIQTDFEEFLRLLNEQHVDFVIVGGYAVAFHGYVRTTDDMDLFFSNTADNIVKIRRALENFGLPTTDAQAEEFADPGSIIRMGIAPVRLEMINVISGCTFDEVWEQRVSGTYGHTPVQYISRAHLLRNKREAGRPKDLADIDELGGNRKTV